MTDVSDRTGGESTRDDKLPAGAFEEWQRTLGERLADADSGYVDLYVRSMLPPPGAKSAQTGVIDRFSDLAGKGPIADVRLNVWGERLCLCETCAGTAAGRAMIDTVREFESWGEAVDASVESFFERCHIESSVTDESCEGIVPPRITAALYLDATLVGVFPCRMGGSPRSVQDLCLTLELALGQRSERTVEP